MLFDASLGGQFKKYEVVAQGKGVCVCRKADAGFEIENVRERRRNKTEARPSPCRLNGSALRIYLCGLVNIIYF